MDALKEKPNVGYMRALSAEGVLSANPTVIVASKDAGPPDVVKALKASAVPYVEVPDDRTPEGAAAKVRFIASLVGADSAGETLAKSVEQDFAALAQDRAKITKPVRAIFVLTVQNGRATVAGATPARMPSSSSPAQRTPHAASKATSRWSRRPRPSSRPTPS